MEPKPASTRCLDRRPAAQKKRASSDLIGPKWPRGYTYARFVDFTALEVSQAIVNAFLARNSISTLTQWRGIPLDGLIKSTEIGVLNHLCGRARMPFAELLDRRNAELVVGVLDEPILTEYDDPVEMSVRVLDGMATPIVMDWRSWRITRRKFSLPNSGYVRGPYFAVVAVDAYDRSIIRSRLWPLWMRSDQSHCALVRSNMERIAVSTVDEAGAIAFTPISKNQLGLLQQACGSFWAGNILWDYLPDLLIMPSRGDLVRLIEIFGLGKFKKYEVGISEKHRQAQAADAMALFRYLGFRPERGCSYEKAIVELQYVVRALVQDMRLGG